MHNKQLVVCVGAAKAGTTTLYELMRRHPEVAVTDAKETDFFVNQSYYRKGYDWYLRENFPSNNKAEILFEADPIYMYARGCIQRIHACAPSARIIVMLRHPVDRAFSQYNYRMTYRRYHETFQQMCERESGRISQDEQSRLEYGCLDRSRYADQVREIYRFFPKNQVYFIVFEEFMRDQKTCFEKLQLWLGLSPVDVGNAYENPGGGVHSAFLARVMYSTGFRGLRKIAMWLIPIRRLRRYLVSAVSKINATARDQDAKPKLDPIYREALFQSFLDDTAELESLTGIDLGMWFELGATKNQVHDVQRA